MRERQHEMWLTLCFFFSSVNAKRNGGMKISDATRSFLRLWTFRIEFWIVLTAALLISWQLWCLKLKQRIQNKNTRLRLSTRESCFRELCLPHFEIPSNRGQSSCIFSQKRKCLVNNFCHIFQKQKNIISREQTIVRGREAWRNFEKYFYQRQIPSRIAIR